MYNGRETLHFACLIVLRSDIINRRAIRFNSSLYLNSNSTEHIWIRLADDQHHNFLGFIAPMRAPSSSSLQTIMPHIKRPPYGLTTDERSMLHSRSLKPLTTPCPIFMHTLSIIPYRRYPRSLYHTTVSIDDTLMFNPLGETPKEVHRATRWETMTPILVRLIKSTGFYLCNHFRSGVGDLEVVFF